MSNVIPNWSRIPQKPWPGGYEKGPWGCLVASYRTFCPQMWRHELQRFEPRALLSQFGVHFLSKMRKNDVQKSLKIEVRKIMTFYAKKLPEWSQKHLSISIKKTFKHWCRKHLAKKKLKIKKSEVPKPQNSLFLMENQHFQKTSRTRKCSKKHETTSLKWS